MELLRDQINESMLDLIKYFQQMSCLSVGSSLEQYKQYAASTFRLNEALNAELSTCYSRISELVEELTGSESNNSKLLEQNHSLKNQLEEVQGEIKVCRERTGISERVSLAENGNVQSNGFYVDFLTTSRSNQTVSGLQKARGKNKSVQTQITDSDEESHWRTKLELEMQGVKEENRLVKKDLAFCAEEIERLNRQIKVHEDSIKVFSQQSTKRVEEIRNKEIMLADARQQLKAQQDQLCSARAQLQHLNPLSQPPFPSQTHCIPSQLKQTNISLCHKIKQLQQFIEILESQNMILKNTTKQNQLKQTRFKALKTQSSLETQLRVMKQQCTQLIKENMKFVEITSRLEKTKTELSKEIEGCKKELWELREKNQVLMYENTEMMKDLNQRNGELVEMNERISLKQSEAKSLKNMASKEIIMQLDSSLGDSKSVKGILGRLISKRESYERKDEIPVRDVSGGVKLPKSRSSVMMLAQIK